MAALRAALRELFAAGVVDPDEAAAKAFAAVPAAEHAVLALEFTRVCARNLVRQDRGAALSDARQAATGQRPKHGKTRTDHIREAAARFLNSIAPSASGQEKRVREFDLDDVLAARARNAAARAQNTRNEHMWDQLADLMRRMQATSLADCPPSLVEDVLTSTGGAL